MTTTNSLLKYRRDGLVAVEMPVTIGHDGEQTAYLLDALVGAAAGLLATVPMSVVMAVGHRMLPWHERYAMPPRLITMNVARARGVESHMDQQERTLATAVAHFGYGSAMGGIYGIVADKSSTRTLGTGAAFGLTVWAVSYLGLLPALGIMRSATKQPTRRTSLMIVAHVVWGAALGYYTNRIGEKCNDTCD